MDLYLLQCKMKWENMLRNPFSFIKRAPEAILLFWMLMNMTLKIIDGFKFDSSNISSLIVSLMMNILFVYGIPMLVYRAVSAQPKNFFSSRADLNFLVPAPRTAFEKFLFTQINLLTSQVFYSLIVVVSFGRIIQYGLHSLLDIVFLISSLALNIACMFNLTYWIELTKRKNLFLTRIVAILWCVGCISLLGIVTFLWINNGMELSTIPQFLSLFFYYPLIGWMIGFTYSLITYQFGMALLYAVLLLLITVLCYQKNKTLDHHLYETDSALLHGSLETEKTVKNNQYRFKNKGELVLIEAAKLKDSKLFSFLGILISTLLFCAILFFAPDNEKRIASSIIFVSMGMWTGGADVDGILMDFYLPILPIKTIYKVTYPLYILVRNRVMTSTLTVLIASVYSIIKGISTEDLLLFVFWWMIITLFFMIQIMWSRNISSLLLGRYKEQMGGKILLFVGALIFTLLVLFPIFAMGAIGWWACVISILFEIVMLVVLLYLSVVLYNSLEKIKKEDNLL